jgi:hypothetical protein
MTVSGGARESKQVGKAQFYFAVYPAFYTTSQVGENSLQLPIRTKITHHHACDLDVWGRSCCIVNGQPDRIAHSSLALLTVDHSIGMLKADG